jgi:hypothetical protein
MGLAKGPGFILPASLGLFNGFLEWLEALNPAHRDPS